MSKPIAIVAPCYNENITVIKFLEELELVLSKSDYPFIVIIVDDSSIDNTLSLLNTFNFSAENLQLKVISLRYNLGHQGAIYQGLLYVSDLDIDHAIIMDSDGEDDPNAIRYLETFVDQEVDIVNIMRGRRREKLSFRFFYKIYKVIFLLITNSSMSFGNYCMINRKIIEATVASSFIHFAAHLSKMKAKRVKKIFDRRRRLDGNSKMNLTNLVYHAFKSFVEYAEDLLMVFLKLFLLLSFLIIILILYVIYAKVFTDEAILGWASTLSATLFNTTIICLGFFVLGVLLLNIMTKKDVKLKEVLFKIIK